MTKKKTKDETAVKEYVALNVLDNSETGAHFEIGDPVKDGDFTPAVIKNWLERTPPNLREAV